MSLSALDSSDGPATELVKPAEDSVNTVVHDGS